MYDDTSPPSPLLPTPLLIAVAGTEGGRIDKHFGQAEDFLIYRQGTEGPELVERRSVIAHEQPGDEDRRDTICRMLADCRVLLVAKIGPVPQERLAGIGIEATDLYAGKDVQPTLVDMFAAKEAAIGAAAVDATSFRLLHAMLRVSDMDRALDFYTRLLGMRVLEMREHKKNQFSQVYLGYGAGWDGMALELVFNWSSEEPYVLGTSFGHIAIQVTCITALCDRLAAAGMPMPRPPRSQRHGENIVAFVEDPDGHRIELVQLPS